MGSSCSILNDTEYDVWITKRINWPLLMRVCVVVAVPFLIAGVIAVIVICVVLAVKGKLTVKHEHIVQMAKMASEAAKIIFNVISKNQKKKQLEDPQEFAREFQAAATLIRPGEKYTWSGTLSLTKRVRVMNELLQFDDKACFTGPTHRSEKVYLISKHFKRLDVRKR